MSDHLPALRPECRQHGPMSLRPAYTPEQAWCGTWYACTTLHCGTTHLLASPALIAQLEEQRARLASSLG